MVGNDLIDLTDAEAAEACLHPRFDARAFAASELAALARAPDRRALRWTLWAAKEAAYKAMRRLDAAVRFHPRAFVVAGAIVDDARDPAGGVVEHAGVRLRVTIERAGAALHAVASSEADVRVSAGFAPIARDESPSAAARRLAVAAAATLLCCEPAELAIVAGPGRVPFLVRAGVPAQAALSLSHHGRFAGFALRKAGRA